MAATPRTESGSLRTPRLQSSLRLGGEAVLSGSPARAAYKRALAKEGQPPQTWPELMKPAGVTKADLQNQRRFQHAGVTELLAMQHTADAKHLSKSSLHGSRCMQTFCRPVPSAAAMYRGRKLRVSILCARGLPNTDSVNMMATGAGSGLSDPYCTCEVVGKPHSKAQTKVISDTLEPVWNQDVDVLDFCEGDSLRFHVWDYDHGMQHGDLLGVATLQSHQFYPLGFEGELPLAEAVEGTQPFLRITVPDMSGQESELNIYGGAFPEEELIGKHIRKFMLCARRLGARGLPRLALAFSTVAAPDGTLDEEGFAKVAMAEGLCSFFEGCSRIFRHFQVVGGGVVHIDMLMASARGIMRGSRLKAVREVWKELDPEGQGYIEVADLTAAFNPHRLPAVRFDGVSSDAALREYLEGLGVCNVTVDCKNEAFALDEAAVGRRPLPIGSPRRDIRPPHHISIHMAGGCVGVAAGKEGSGCEMPRRHNDYIQEVQMRPPRVLQDARISASQFEDFYTALSHGISDDRLFERTLRDPWTSRQIHEETLAARWDTSPRRKISPKAPQFSIAATFADGSHRVVLLSNIDGLSEAIGHAGVHCSQMWTWGPGIKTEVIRRLEAEGVHGVVQVKPIPC